MTVSISTDALADLERGAQFYEHKESGLGSYFLDSLYSDIDSLQLYGGVHRIVFGKHRFCAKRFPFAIFYVVGNGVIEVRAVMDCRQKPSKIDRVLRRR